MERFTMDPEKFTMEQKRSEPNGMERLGSARNCNARKKTERFGMERNGSAWNRTEGLGTELKRYRKAGLENDRKRKERLGTAWKGFKGV